MTNPSDGLRDLLQRFAGLSGRNIEPLPPNDVRLRITLEEAYHGTEKEIALPQSSRVALRVPRGIRHGAIIKVTLRGRDFRIGVEVEPHAWFERRDDDLLATIVVGAEEALLGKSVLVRTMTGTATLSLPRLTRDGAEFVFREAGMPMRDNPAQFGDLRCTVRVKA